MFLCIAATAQAASTSENIPLHDGIVLKITGIQRELYRRDSSPPEKTVHYSLSLPGPSRLDAETQLHNFFARNSISAPASAMITEDLSEAAQESSAQFIADITALLPEVMHRYFKINGIDMTSGDFLCAENCLGAARAFGTAASAVAFADLPEFSKFLMQNYKEVPPSEAALKFGDIIFFEKSGHAAVYLFDGFIFQKPSFYPYHPYEIVAFHDIFKTRNRTVIALRSNPVPDAQYFHPSTSQAFNGAMRFQSPLEAPSLQSKTNPYSIWRSACEAALTTTD